MWAGVLLGPGGDGVAPGDDGAIGGDEHWHPGLSGEPADLEAAA
jgi:hypothetical protein